MMVIVIKKSIRIYKLNVMLFYFIISYINYVFCKCFQMLNDRIILFELLKWLKNDCKQKKVIILVYIELFTLVYMC